MDTLAGQVHGFAAAIAAGLTCSSIIQTLAESCPLERAVTALSDLLFWLIATPVTYIYLLIGNWAELRFYVFLPVPNFPLLLGT